MSRLTDNAARSRFEWVEEGMLVFADYFRHDGVLVLPHVESDPALRGRGAAGRLMAAILEFARTENLKVSPVCSYAVAYLQRHPEYRDLLV